MTTKTLPEAKRAWLISQLIEELNNLLWKRYEDEFVSFVLEKEDPDEESTTSDMEQIDGPSQGDLNVIYYLRSIPISVSFMWGANNPAPH